MPAETRQIAVTFVQPLFLIGLSLSVIPIIIHLWFRKRLKKIPFSTLTFLKKTDAKRFGWLRLREIIILLLRCLVIACLFLSLAKPRVSGKLFRTGRLASVVLIIDNSGSMKYGDRFAGAIQRAQEAIAQYSPHSEFMVVPLCRVPLASDSVSWINPRSAGKRITGIQPSYSTGRIAELYRRVSVSDARHEVEYLYIGDGQEISFTDFPAELTRNDNFLMTVMPGGSNAAITRVALKDPVAIPLARYVLLVHVKNYSRYTWYGTVSLTAGEYFDEQECMVGSENEIPIEFEIPVGLKHGTVRLHDDSLSIDNVYYFAKTLGRTLCLLVIGPDIFLRPALLPTQTEEPPFTVSTAPHLDGIDLRQYDVVILNARDISPSDRMRLENFLGQPDKSVICCLDDTVMPELAEFIHVCCSPESLVVPRGYVTLDWVDFEHPVFDIFGRSTGLRNTKFFRFYRVLPRGRVIAKLTGGYPFITVSGNLAVVSAQFSPQVTDIVYKAAFVPMLHRLIVSTTFQTHDSEFYVDDIMKDFESARAPTGESLRKGQAFFMPGFHTAGGSTLGVNIDPIESNLKPLGPDAARALNIQQLDFSRDIGSQDLSSFFLLCALCALALELLLLIIK
jgi:hypothetical protein